MTKGSSNLAGWQPKNDIEARHKAICFGAIQHAATEEEANLYKFYHQRADLKVSEGYIPVGFYASIPLEEGQPIFLQTRYGDFDPDGNPVGPQYQVSWNSDKEVVPPIVPGTDGWSNNLDELWSNVLAYFERKSLLGEESLQYLDADPFVLFGIDDGITQKALLKLERFPALLCEASTPNLDEWAYYIRIDPTDSVLNWLVRAFQETDLPKPWTCYKGVGSIVCYIRSDTGQVTWKHPFYDYFRQLRDFCRQASPEEVLQVRCNRLLWTYEATRDETDHEMEPLVSPDYVARMAEIFGYDVKVQGIVVRNIKAQLKAMAGTYRQTQNIAIEQVKQCAELLALDTQKYDFMYDHWKNKFNEVIKFDLVEMANGQVKCVNCQETGMCFCLECKDYLCISCYDSLHNKGARLHHAPFRLVPCCLCVCQPAKLHCTFTDKSLCHSCYALKHIKQLPPDGKENQPRRIDYVMQYNRYAQMAKERSGSKIPELNATVTDLFSASEDYETVLSHDWHPFYDARGVKFYHNFATGERMRQSPRRVPNTADPGALPLEGDGLRKSVNTLVGAYSIKSSAGDGTEKLDDMRSQTAASGISRQMFNASSSPGATAKRPRLPLSGFDSLETEPAVLDAAEQPELRNLRPPHRKHMPMQEAAD